MELQIIQSKIYEIRGYKIILDKYLAELYEVTTSNLNKSVKRNLDRFTEDFMFQLNNKEFDLIFQNGISSWGGTRKFPYAFTEHGIAILAGLLNSQKAILVNISIIRAFVAIRNYLMQQATTSHEIEKLWTHVKSLEQQTEENLKVVNDLSEDTQNTFDENLYCFI